MYDNDTLVDPPRPKPVEDPMYREFRERFEREERERQNAQAKRDAAYEQRSRNFKISKSAVLGGDAYPEEE